MKKINMKGKYTPRVIVFWLGYYHGKKGLVRYDEEHMEWISSYKTEQFASYHEYIAKVWETFHEELMESYKRVGELIASCHEMAIEESLNENENKIVQMRVARKQITSRIESQRKREETQKELKKFCMYAENERIKRKEEIYETVGCIQRKMEVYLRGACRGLQMKLPMTTIIEMESDNYVEEKVVEHFKKILREEIDDEE